MAEPYYACCEQTALRLAQQTLEPATPALVLPGPEPMFDLEAS